MLYKIADAYATLHGAELTASGFNEEVRVIAEEDYAAGFVSGVQYKGEKVLEVKRLIAELITTCEAFDERCALSVAYKLEDVCKKL
jgi:hypothetical protein